MVWLFATISYAQNLYKRSGKGGFCSEVKKNNFYKKIELLIFYKIFSGGRTSLFQGTTGVCE